MKRDMDLVRKILFTLEECADPSGPIQGISIEGYSNHVVAYHVKILAQAGLIEATECELPIGAGPEDFECLPGSLTWQGHEFLDAARDDTRWNKTKALLKERIGGLTFEALKFALTEGIKSQLS